MSAIIVGGHRLAELAETLGIDPAQATTSRIIAALTPAAANAYAGRIKAREIRDKALALDAADAGRQQPEHAGEWESIAAALRCQSEDPR